MKKVIKPWVWQIFIFIALYVLLGNSRSVSPNPFIPGSVVAVNMILPVIAGMLFGPRVGIYTGFFGTVFNAVLTGSPFEYLAIIPHAIMGFTAGKLKDKVPSPFVPLSLIIGHILNLLVFMLVGLMPYTTLLTSRLWVGIGYEIFIGIIAILVLTSLFQLFFIDKRPKNQLIRKRRIQNLSLNLRIWTIIGLITVILTFIFVIFFYFRSIFIIFMVGGILLVFTDRILQNFSKRIVRYKLSKIKVKLIGGLVLVFWLFAIIFLISDSISQLSDVVKTLSVSGSITEEYIKLIEPFVPKMLSSKLINPDFIQKFEIYVSDAFTNALSLVTNLVINGILIIPLMFYMYYRRSQEIKDKIAELLPEKYAFSILKASIEIKAQLQDFLSAKVIESTIIGIICCLGFYVAGLKGWLFLGILAGILNIIPYLGPFIGAIPPVMIALLDEPIVVLYVIIIVVIAQLLDNLYLIPFMISDKVQIDSLLSIVLILIGAQLVGPIGMILALPIYLIYKTILIETYIELLKLYDR